MDAERKTLKTTILQYIVERTKPLGNFFLRGLNSLTYFRAPKKPQMSSPHVVRGKGLDPFHVTRHGKIQSSFFTQK